MCIDLLAPGVEPNKEGVNLFLELGDGTIDVVIFGED